MSTTSTPTPELNRDVVEKFREFLQAYYDDRSGEGSPIAELAKGYPSEQRTLEVDWYDVYRFDADLADDLLEQPDLILEHAETALAEYDLPIDETLDRARIRVTNLPESTVIDVGSYRDEDTGEMLGVRGQVAKRTEVKVIAERIAFECVRCGSTTNVPQEGDTLQEPHECNGCERSGPFSVDRDDSEFRNYQAIRLQIPPERAEGHSDTHIDAILADDLVGIVEPGDRIICNGVLDLREEDGNEPIYEFYLKGRSIEVLETDFEDIDYDEYKDEVNEIANGEPFEDLVDSIAPAIHGHRSIKLAVALQLFGGVKKPLPSGSTERGDFHILLVGDPGTAKSSILDHAAELAPRSIYTDGHGSTSAGLTASAVRDEWGTGQWSIEGGSLVKAHRGVCCIDELDKMADEDRSAINTALEKQEIEVSKAGIDATMPAETRVLAAANPEYGRFNVYEPIAKQIDMAPHLLSRFDLIFTITDQVDPDRDLDIIEHKLQTAKVGQVEASGIAQDVDSDAVEPAIDPEVLRAYVGYARQHINPVFTQIAEEEIKQAFHDLRAANQEQTDDPENGEDATVPVTFRKQEAFHRLAEASARVRLSDTVESQDVQRARELIVECMKNVGVDPDTGEFDADVIETGTSQSQQERVQYVYRVIEELQDEEPAGHESIVNVCETEGYERSVVEQTLEDLKHKGRIYEPRQDHYRTT